VDIVVVPNGTGDDVPGRLVASSDVMQIYDVRGAGRRQ
jgi:hypothetical protein